MRFGQPMPCPDCGGELEDLGPLDGFSPGCELLFCSRCQERNERERRRVPAFFVLDRRGRLVRPAGLAQPG